MNRSEIKELIIRSLDEDTDSVDVYERLENEGVRFDFKNDFTNSVIDKLFPVALHVTREIEFLKYMSFAFRSIALSGIAAIILLLISIFLRDGSISLDSFLGLRNNYDESIICLLTGN